MVLLHVLSILARRHGWHLTVAHLNHQLRGRASAADERLVRATARKLRLPIVVERVKVREFARTQALSLEMAARQLRHEFLARIAARLHLGTVALAHHADDQLELFFLRLLRGSSGQGLSGMKWQSASPANAQVELVRPLLDQPKVVLRQYTRQNHIPFREDATNQCLDIQRNRIRHELLPLLRKYYQPALDRTVLRLMELVGAEAQFTTDAAQDWLEELDECENHHQPARRRQAKGQTPKLFDALPLAVQRRGLQSQLLHLGITPDFELVERLRLSPNQPLSVPAPIQSATMPTTVSVRRDERGRLHLSQTAPAGFNERSVEMALAGTSGEVLFDGTTIQWRLARPPRGWLRPRPGEEWFDAAQVGSPIVLRHWQPGDRFQPIGLGKSVKLQDFFTNTKVPRQRRHDLLLGATRQGEVFWVEAGRISERFKLTKSTIRGLQWRWYRL